MDVEKLQKQKSRIWLFWCTSLLFGGIFVFACLRLFLPVEHLNVLTGLDDSVLDVRSVTRSDHTDEETTTVLPTVENTQHGPYNGPHASSDARKY